MSLNNEGSPSVVKTFRHIFVESIPGYEMKIFSQEICDLEVEIKPEIVLINV
jgi:hypothetical protein